MLLDPAGLPPGPVAETVEVGSPESKRYRRITFYRVPALSQGPEVRKDRDGRLYLAYMYHSFVFHWYRGDGVVHIMHGHIGGANNLPLVWKLNIEESWDRAVLARRGKQWVRDHLARFTRPC